jgi:hypothetical protein
VAAQLTASQEVLSCMSDTDVTCKLAYGAVVCIAIQMVPHVFQIHIKDDHSGFIYGRKYKHQMTQSVMMFVPGEMTELRLA